MRTPFSRTDAGGSSFLPEDYIEKKTERRANLIYLTLFAVVIFSVVGAFFVTNRQWATVKSQQQAINMRYTKAAQDIELLKSLEAQKQQRMSKAELTMALIEKAPRSLLLAEIINRMPEKLTLLELELESKRIEPPKAAAPSAQAGKQGPKSLASKTGAATAKAQATPRAPTFDTRLVIIGVAASNNEIASYITTLKECPLLERVELRFSESTIINNRGLSKFRIEAQLRPGADARHIEPLAAKKGDVFGADAGGGGGETSTIITPTADAGSKEER